MLTALGFSVKAADARQLMPQCGSEAYQPAVLRGHCYSGQEWPERRAEAEQIYQLLRAKGQGKISTAAAGVPVQQLRLHLLRHSGGLDSWRTRPMFGTLSGPEQES